jgi:TRAP-type C4-dicarboxylate transport system substrate-binding protein
MISRRGFIKGAIAGSALMLGASFLGCAEKKEEKPQAEVMTLRISHQWAQGDVRDTLSRKFAEKVEKKTDGALKFEIYPAKSLFKPKAQFDAMVEGALDMSVFPLDYASGKVPQFSITLMPCIITSIDHGMKWIESEIGQEVERIMEASGIKMITWAWFGGGIGSIPKPITYPEDVKGLKMRAAGKMFEYMLHEAGAAITSMPSSELYQALQTGVLDACLTSSSSFYSYRLYEQLKYYNSPRNYAIWFMLEPLVMSMATWNKLTPEQQKIVSEVGKELQEFMREETKKENGRVADIFAEKGVEVHDMTKDEWDVWAEFARNTAWKKFAQDVEGGQKLIDLALQV